MVGGHSGRKPLVALMDESILRAGNGVYLVGTVLIEERQKGTVRADLRRLVPPRHRFHFHAEQRRTRLAVMGLLAECAERSLVHRVSPAPQRRHEASRRQCVAGLLADLREADVRELIIDSRDSHKPRNDLRDRSQILATIQAGRLPPELAYHHVHAGDEPLLWLADALAGAGLAAERGCRDYLDALPADRLVVRNTP